MVSNTTMGGELASGSGSLADSFAISDGDAIALLTFTALVFMQQPGFAALEAGSVRAKNTANILLTNIVDKLVCGICYMALGFGFAFGKSAGGVIGYSHFALTNPSKEVYLLWFFSFNFLLTSCTIVSGAIAERAEIQAYVAYAAVMSVIIYPITTHWTQGWLATLLPCRYLDFAGGSTVHLIGGVAALVGAWTIGPRRGRFEPERKKMVGHSLPLVAVGAFMLWFGWYGFNIAPSFLQGDFRSTVAGRAAVNTTLSICSAAFVTLCIAYHRTSQMDVQVVCNGILAGAVAITGLTPHVDPWAALLIGFLGGIVYMGGSWLVEKCGIDDPLDAGAVHGMCSLVGLLGAGFLVKLDYLEQYRSGQPRLCSGLFFWNEGGPRGGLLAIQLIGVTVIILFSGTVSLALFMGLHKMKWLRVEYDNELQGLDLLEGRKAYPDFVLVNGGGDSGRMAPALPYVANGSHQVEMTAVGDVEQGSSGSSNPQADPQDCQGPPRAQRRIRPSYWLKKVGIPRVGLSSLRGKARSRGAVEA